MRSQRQPGSYERGAKLGRHGLLMGFGLIRYAQIAPFALGLRADVSVLGLISLRASPFFSQLVYLIFFRSQQVLLLSVLTLYIIVGRYIYYMLAAPSPPPIPRPVARNRWIPLHY